MIQRCVLRSRFSKNLRNCRYLTDDKGGNSSNITVEVTEASADGTNAGMECRDDQTLSDNDRQIAGSTRRTEDTNLTKPVSGLLKVFDMFEKATQSEGRSQVPPVVRQTDASFASLLRNSKIMQLGDPNGRLVVGTIIEVRTSLFKGPPPPTILLPLWLVFMH